MRTTIGLALLLAACSGASSAGRTTARGDGVPSPPAPWAQLDAAAKREWMAQEVLPRMSELFQAQGPERYADFSCATCHGPSPQDRGFEMPSPALPALYPTGTPEQQQMVQQYEAQCRFMFSRVLPTMQALLGAPDYDEATQEGFSCYSCHPHAGDEGSTPIRLGSSSEGGAAP